jgi:two-component system response regulator NreC
MFTAPKICLIIADDHELIRVGLKVLISRHHALKCVGVASDGDETVALALRLRPDVVIMDLTMPSCGGLEATSLLRKQAPETKVVAYSGSEDTPMILAALRAGVLSYVSKASPHDVLIEAILAVAKGKYFVDPALTDPLLRDFVEAPAMEHSSMLTPREREVLQRVAWGFANRETALELGLSPKTVEGYRARACEKLFLADRPAIVKYALMAGWMDH